MDPFEERRARVRAQVDEAQARAAAATRFRQETDRIRGRGRDRSGDVEVVVDSAGVLLGVELARDYAWLADAVLEAYRRARADAGEQVVASASESFGEEDPMVERLKSVYLVKDQDEKDRASSRRSSPTGFDGILR